MVMCWFPRVGGGFVILTPNNVNILLGVESKDLFHDECLIIWIDLLKGGWRGGSSSTHDGSNSFYIRTKLYYSGNLLGGDILLSFICMLIRLLPCSLVEGTNSIR